MTNPSKAAVHLFFIASIVSGCYLLYMVFVNGTEGFEDGYIPSASQGGGLALALFVWAREKFRVRVAISKAWSRSATMLLSLLLIVAVVNYLRMQVMCIWSPASRFSINFAPAVISLFGIAYLLFPIVANESDVFGRTGSKDDALMRIER